MWRLGWVGTKVKNVDGRTGTIVGEYMGFCYAGLTIKCDDGTSDYVQLNSNGPDTGETGVWEWHCENFSGGARWIDLTY